MYENRKPYGKLVEQINACPVKDLSDQEIREELHTSLVQDDNRMVKVFSLVQEIIFRLAGISLFDTQLSTAISLYRGRIAELPTGEGKTLAAVLPAVLYALDNYKVHIFTFNDYLAKRDYLLNRQFFEFCGLKASYIDQEMNTDERRIAYESDILYLTVKEAGFDYLRDFLCQNSKDLLSPSKDIAIIDEADSILIDEARIPLIVAGISDCEDIPWPEVSSCVQNLTPGRDFQADEMLNQIWLTDQGIGKAETMLQAENLYSPENAGLLAAVNTSLQAHFLLIRDRDYVVKSGIQIIDEYTGRVAEGRKYPDQLQRAVEAKEDLAITSSSKIYNSIAIQHYLSLYKKICGMTGTAATSAGELREIYGLEIDVIPPHCPSIRIDHPDRLFSSQAEKHNAVVQEVINANGKGQPVLIGTASVYESQVLAQLLEQTGISPRVLNAKNDEHEAELIAQAGEPFRVTVSTNMAGRGVDIKLGGPGEAEKAAVERVGGLYVIGTNRHDSVRIDNQLRGRAGRQGDPGQTRFFVSLEDDLLAMNKFQEWIPAKKLRLILQNSSLDPHVQQVLDTIQRLSEGACAEARHMLSQYSHIIEEQRRIITELHRGILVNSESPGFLAALDPDWYEKLKSNAGATGVSRAERQLALFFINQHWADYLEYMGTVRESIHLMTVGRRNPLDEYHRIAITAFTELQESIAADVVERIKTVRINPDGIDLDAEGLGRSSLTWTYMINDSADQFSRLPQLLHGVSRYMKGSLFTVSGLIHWLKTRLAEKKY